MTVVKGPKQPAGEEIRQLRLELLELLLFPDSFPQSIRAELREAVKRAMREDLGGYLNDSIADKVVTEILSVLKVKG